jgi:CRP/FNR family cyclic AMP-dependent transcriptional regulator
MQGDLSNRSPRQRLMSNDNEEKTSPSGQMISRFAGDSGQNLLLEVLSDESILRGMPNLSNFIAACALQEVAIGTELIKQGESDNDIFIIVSGSFETRINGRRQTTRHVGTHIGEIALIDPTARRTASAVAVEHSLVLRCTEGHFSQFANVNPKVWRRLAVELSRRLTERNHLIRAPRAEPVVFLACSTETLGIAHEIQAAFDHEPITVEIWIDGVFNPSNTPIEDLTHLIGRIDFAVILMTGDDKIVSRKGETFGPRDNVIFELGLAIGAIGRARTLMITPRGEDLKFPSDLLGVRPIDFPTGEASTIKSRLGPACNEIRKLVNRLGPI